MDVYLKGKKIRLDPQKSIGKGGEADVYAIGNGLAVKVFKSPKHPDYDGLPHEQKGAEKRLQDHQKKLPAFPTAMPSRVVVPMELATDKSGKKVLGYAMPMVDDAEKLIRYADIPFRNAGVSNEDVVEVFKDLYQTVVHIHDKDIVLGDFNDLNVLVKDHREDYIIDADSFQFDKWYCTMFTKRFVDPLLCDPKLKSLMLYKPHNQLSDWYAFNVMLWQCLLMVDPYGGVYKPKNRASAMPHDSRPLHRITVFNPEVKYPKKATHFSVLPDGLLQHFQETFEKDKREVFPIRLLEDLQFVQDSTTGKIGVVAPQGPVEVRGQVTSEQIFQTKGNIVFTTVQDGRLLWLYYEDGTYKRESGKKILASKLSPKYRFRINRTETFVGEKNTLQCIPSGRMVVDRYESLPLFDVNSHHIYWVQDGDLKRNNSIGDKTIGQVFPNQTLFWVGENFGFGFFRAGNITKAFVFDAEKLGIKFDIDIPPIRGQLIDSTCVFSGKIAWFFTATQESGDIIHRCFAIDDKGKILGQTEGKRDDNTWLGSIRGKTASGNLLFSATDEGIVKVSVDRHGFIKVDTEFPDTEPFVDSSSKLFTGSKGLYVVRKHDIQLLKIA